MQVAKRYQDELERIKKNVQTSYQYFRPNYERYHKFRKFVFETSLSEGDIALLQRLKKPQLEFNVLEAYISRLRGEFSKQEPSINVEAADGAPIDPATIAVTEGHFRAILSEANKDSFEYNIYTDLLSGGFSVIKVWTEYANEMSFNQVIRLGRVFDPTLCGFDMTAQLQHKGDGDYCFENYPKTADEFREEFGSDIRIDNLKYSKNIEGFNWSYATEDNRDIILMSDYYEKKKRKARIVQLADGQTMTTEDYEEYVEKWRASGRIEQPPAASKSRNSHIPVICRYQLIENQVIDYTETDFRHLPRIFVDGNSILMRDSANGSVKQLTRPYVYHAKDQQRLINFAGQSLANDLENMVQHKWKVAKEGIPPEYAGAYTDNQVPSVVVYNAYADDEQEKAVPPPQEVVRTPSPPEVTNTFMTGAQMIQNILGSYDASLGINNNQLSGVAIVEGATQSNAAAMPYVVGFLQGLTQAAVICLDLMPKYYVTPRTMPIVRPDGKKSYVPINQPGGINLNYQANALNVTVEAGVNFAIQKSRALQQIISLCQASPLFAQFINQMGLEVLLDNLEIRGIDQLKVLAQKFMQQLQQQQQQQMQQPNPAVMKMQLDQQKLQASQQQDQVENQLRAAEIAQTSRANDIDAAKVALQSHQAGSENAVQIAKAKAETYSKAVDIALKVGDQQHKHILETTEQAHQHAHDVLTLAHQVDVSNQQQQSTGENQNG
jgi:hypothetical protein